ncbi:Pol protein [Phytophthora palmivora]|uniref:Pol protein n=1 Tax=Phytophthora palmivora TaxID=4796 RepID=A0A2P4XAT8_9STRA|nr:Pol protein [Phytophthora palmivora]
MAHTVEFAFPAYDEPFHIYTDTSGYHKKCNESQRKYPANRLELLSIVLVLRENRTMLLGQELHIRTEHLNLTYGAFNNIQMTRWLLEIEEFGPSLHYIKGEHNVVADALSRLPGETSPELGKDDGSGEAAVQESADDTVLFSLDLRQLARAQAIVQSLGGRDKELNGVKLRVGPKTDAILVPDHLQEPVMKAYHEWLMHPGASAMYQTINVSPYWKGMESHIRQYVRNCLPCTKSKHPTLKYGKYRPKLSWCGRGSKWRSIQSDLWEAQVSRLDDGRHEYQARENSTMRVIYDQGTEFKKEFFELLESFGIHAVPTTTRSPQANGIIERLHRVIGEKMRTQEINSKDKGLHFCITRRLQCGQPTTACWMHPRPKLPLIETYSSRLRTQRTGKSKQVAKNNTRENSKRRTWTYAPGDNVLLQNDAGSQAKMTPLFNGSYKAVAVRTNGTLVLDKGKYMETVHIRRVVPFKSQRVEGCENTQY